MANPVDRLAAEIVGLRRRIEGLGAGPQLAFSSIEAGAIDEYDKDGKLVSVIGQQWDNTHGAFSVSGPPPPTPTAPTVEVNIGASIGWDGHFVNDADGLLDLMISAPMDWSRVELHISQVQGFRADTADTLVDTIESPRGGSRPVLPAPGTWYAVLVARSLSGKRSEQSAETTFEVENTGLSAAELEQMRKDFKAESDRLAADLQKNADAQAELGVSVDALKNSTLPALAAELDAAGLRLDTADNLLNVVFPKRMTDVETKASNATTAATAAQTKAAAAETAAAKAAADLVTAKARADAAATAATTAAAEADAAEASAARATGAAGTAELAADKSAKDAAAALLQAQNAGGNVSTAQAAAAAAQTAADAAKAQASAAGTSAAAADAKAAQAAADAAKAAADALTAQQKATTAASEAAAAKTSAGTSSAAATKAEAAATAAQGKANTAASDAAAAALKATAAEASATKATGAAGVAETAADKAAKDAAAALTQATNSGSNATAAQRAADAAKVASDTAAAQATTAGTAAAKADAAAAKAAADAAQAAADLIVAKNAAADARGDANTALQRADSAITQAGSAARVLYSTANPSGTAREGDTWRKTNGDAGDVIAEWRYTKVGTAAASWKPQKVTSDMVSNLDVGKLTAGTAGIVQLVAEKIAASTAAIQKADIGNLTVTGSSQLADVVAEKMSAKIGEFITVKTSQLTADSANFKTGVAERFASGIGSFLKLYASQVYIGEAGNVFPTDFNDDGWQSGNGITRSEVGGKTGGSSMLIPASTVQIGSYFGIAASNRDRAPRLIPGSTYRIKASIRSDAAIPVGGARVYVRLYKIGSTIESGYSWATPSSVSNTKAVAANAWGEVDGTFSIPDDSINTVAVVGVYSQPTATGALRYSELTIQPVITPSLVVDGLVSGQNIIGAMIQSNGAANRGTKMLDTGLFAWDSTGKETLRFDGTNSIITGATLRTAASGARWQMSETGLEAWDATGKRYLYGAASGLEMVGTMVASGDTTDTGGSAGSGIGTVYTSRAILGRRMIEPGADNSPGLYFEVEAGGVLKPAGLYPAGISSTSPYEARGVVIHGSRRATTSPSTEWTVSDMGVNGKTRWPYSNGYAASSNFHMNVEGGMGMFGTDGYPASGDAWRISAESREAAKGKGTLRFYGRERLDLEGGVITLNGREYSDSKWKLASYAAPWTSYGNGFSPLSYRVVDGILYVMGSIKGGVSGSRVTTLPVGYRPTIPTGTEALEAPLTATQGGNWYAGSLWFYGDGRVVYTAPPGTWAGADRAIINASFPLG